MGMFNSVTDGSQFLGAINSAQSAISQLNSDLKNNNLSYESILGAMGAMASVMSYTSPESYINFGWGNVSAADASKAAAVASWGLSIAKVHDSYQEGLINTKELQGLISTTFGVAAQFTGKKGEAIFGTAEILTSLIAQLSGDHIVHKDEFLNAENALGFFWEVYTDWSKAVYSVLPDSWNPWLNLDRNESANYRIAEDPLVLDLDGDGIETVGTNGWNGVNFDHNKDGIAAGSGWIKPDDGFLVYDRNNDGLINDGGELFGNNTILSNGEKASDGFAALADLDSNGDGVIDAKDKAFNSLKVWRDLNQDGKVDEGELFTLKELQIASLNLTNKDINKNLGNGNTLTQLGSYTKEDGTEHQMGDINLAVDDLHTVHVDPIELTSEQAGQLNIKGQGNLRDLVEAAALSNDLNNLLNQYKQLQTRDEQLALIDDIVKAWAKTDPAYDDKLYSKIMFTTIDSSSKNVIYVSREEYMKLTSVYVDPEYIKARDKVLELADKGVLAILDAFTGSKTEYLNLLRNPQGILDAINKSYQQLLDSVYDALLFQTRLKPYVDQVGLTYTEKDGIAFDYSAMNELFEQTYQENTKKAVEDLAEMLSKGGDITDWNGLNIFSQWLTEASETGRLSEFTQWINDINPYDYTNTGFKLVTGSDIDDVINSPAANSIVIAGQGNDTIKGRGIINGGKGDDVINLTISSSADTLMFNLGDGKDTITSTDNTTGYDKRDKIIFGKDVTTDMISFRREGNNLIVVVGDQGDEMSFVNYFSSNLNQNFNRFEFADGTVWEDIRTRVFTQYYSDQADSITGTGWNDAIYAGAGNDVITDNWGTNYLDGGDGNDTITGRGTVNGGKGDDVINLTISSSADTLMFNLGDGKDTITSTDNTTGYDKRDKIIFGKDVTTDMISFRREGNNLIVVVGDQGDEMSFVNYFSSNLNQNFNRFEFADGTVWEDIRQGLNNQMWTYRYGDQNDTILGTSYNDAIYAGGGDDIITDTGGINYLDGGDGNDTITGRGTVNGGKGDDVINLTISSSADTLMFNLGDGKDTITSTDNTTGYDKRDKIIFGKDVTTDMISFRREGNNLIVVVGDQGDEMSFVNYFSSNLNQNFNRFEFADGTVWEDIRTRVFTQYYSDQADSITGTGWNDAIYAGAGNDVITDNWGTNYLDGGDGNDTITGRGTVNGGKGDDVINLTISSSADTLMFNLGDGKDTITSTDNTTGYDKRDKIIFGKDVTTDMISFRREGNNLIVVVGDQGDEMSFVNYFSSNLNQNFNRFEFADGTVWEDIRQGLNNQMWTYRYGDQNDTILGTSYNDAIYAGGGDDIITDTGGINYLDGGDGNDTITGRGTVNGGKGDDVINLTISSSADTLMFNLGDGKDTITSTDNTTGYDKRDKIIFGKDVTTDMISFRREGNNLIVVVGDQGDEMSFVNYFSSNLNQNFNRFEFADGTVWEDIRTRVFTQYYSDQADSITGTGWNDAIYAGAGNDVITDNWGTNYLDGGDGNDTITGRGTVNGGKGDDVINLTISSSADTLMFNLGDGKDTITSTDNTTGYDKRDKIIFGKDVTTDMISFRREGNNLIVVVGDQGDEMSFVNYFSSNLNQNFNRFEFADGTVWEDIRTRVFTQYYSDQADSITGTGWNDAIYAGAGNDVITDNWGTNYLDGGDGNDTITGRGTVNGGKGDDVINLTISSSADTLMFNLGDGKDTITSTDNTTGYDKRDKIIFGKDVTADMISFRREGNNLIVVVGDQGDEMSFVNYFSSNLNQNFNRFEFADESVWTDIRQMEQFKNMPVVQPMTMAASFANTNSSSLESQTDNLVIAMATFAVTGADTSLLQDKSDDINNIMLTVNAV